MSNDASPKQRHGVDLTQGSVLKHFVSLGVFLSLSVVSVTATNLADVYFAGKLSTHALAALSFTFPVVMVVNGIAFGMGSGAMTVIARAVGEGDHRRIRALTTDSILLTLFAVVILSAIGYSTIDWLFPILGADAEIMPVLHSYMHIWYLGTAVQIIPQVGQSIVRAHGDTRTPGIIAAVMSTINIVMDPILMFGWGPIPAFGLEGAAMAGIIARFVSLIGIMAVMHYRLHGMARISFSPARLNGSWRRILHIGLPTTATQLVVPISSAILTKIIALSGTLAVAAFGVGTRIELLNVVYLWAVVGALPAFIGQNAGAGQVNRVREAVNIAIKFSCAIAVVWAVVLWMSGPQIVAHFTDDAHVRELSILYLRTVSISYPVAGLVLVSTMSLNALHRPMLAAIVSLSRTVVVLVPIVLVGQWLWQIHGVFTAIAIANVVCGAMGLFMIRKALDEESDKHAAATANEDDITEPMPPPAA